MKFTTILILALFIASGSLSAQSDNDYCNNRLGISEGYTYFDNSQATVSQGWPADCWDVEEEASLWFQFATPPYPSSVTLEIVSDSIAGAMDTQIGITSQGCGTDYLYCDEDSGEGDQAALYFECGELQQNTAYIFVVNSSFASAGAAFINLQFDGSCGDSLIYGCMDPVALNYNPFVNVDDGSCYYWEDSLALFGCTDPLALNFDSLALYDDNSCIYDTDSTDVYGCTDFLALNYNPLATLDDGSCYYVSDSLDYFGCLDPIALNYDPIVVYDDGTCQYSDSLGGGYGCTDPSALNYDPDATNLDYSCEYASCHAEFIITEIDQDNNVVYIINSSTSTGGEINYIWEFGDGSISYDAYPIHEYAENGTYEICLTLIDSTFGCFDTYCDTLTFFGFSPGGNGEEGVVNGFTVNILDPQVLGVEELEFISDLSVYPNPSNGDLRLTLNSTKSQALELSIIDAMGREVWNKQMRSTIGEQHVRIALQDIPEGIYLLSVSSADAIETRSILIAR